MIIQSLSVCVPAACLNNCRYCVSHMHRSEYKNKFTNMKSVPPLLRKQYKQRLVWALRNDCNTMILTGSGEPLLNKSFLEFVGNLNNELGINGFQWIELQTSGTNLDEEYLDFLAEKVGVSTISLSLADMYSSKNNAYINRTQQGHEVDIDKICKLIKSKGFNLRLSLNMTNVYNGKELDEIFDRLKELDANQVTLRKFYTSGSKCEEDVWIEENKCDETHFTQLVSDIRMHGKPLQRLPFGSVKYSYRGVSVVIDDDCMSKKKNMKVLNKDDMDIESRNRNLDNLKYCIIRQDCHMYSSWDDKGSLMF